MRNDSNSPDADRSSLGLNVTVRLVDTTTKVLFGVEEIYNEHSFVYRKGKEWWAFPHRNVISIHMVNLDE